MMFKAEHFITATIIPDVAKYINIFSAYGILKLYFAFSDRKKNLIGSYDKIWQVILRPEAGDMSVHFTSEILTTVQDYQAQITMMAYIVHAATPSSDEMRADRTPPPRDKILSTYVFYTAVFQK